MFYSQTLIILASVVARRPHDAVELVPIYEGVATENAINRSRLSGEDATVYLRYCLFKRGYNFLESQPQSKLFDDIRKASAFVYDYDEFVFRRQEEKSAEQTFKLPDGQTIRFGNDASKSAERLFDPGINGLDIVPIHCALHRALDKRQSPSPCRTF